VPRAIMQQGHGMFALAIRPRPVTAITDMAEKMSRYSSARTPWAVPVYVGEGHRPHLHASGQKYREKSSPVKHDAASTHVKGSRCNGTVDSKKAVVTGARRAWARPSSSIWPRKAATSSGGRQRREGSGNRGGRGREDGAESRRAPCGRDERRRGARRNG